MSDGPVRRVLRNLCFQRPGSRCVLAVNGCAFRYHELARTFSCPFVWFYLKISSEKESRVSNQMPWPGGDADGNHLAIARLVPYLENAMGIISWILLGLVAGALAKFIMPGKDPGGIIVTILIGIVGAVLGGFLGSFIGFGKIESFDLGGILIATLGAILLLAIYRIARKKRA